MARANLSKLADRDVTPVPAAEPTPAAPSTPDPAPITRRRSAEPVDSDVEEEALGTDVPKALKRELKTAAAIHGEKMKHIVARAIRRELDRMNDDQ